MSKNLNRKKLDKSINNHHYRILFLNFHYPPYYDEGWNWKNKNISNHKAREFKTWKHTRKTQYK